MNLTIHSHDELPNEVKHIIEAYAEVRLKGIEDVAPLLEDALEKLGFIVTTTDFSLTTQQVDIYLSRMELQEKAHPEACTCDECAAIRFAFCGYED